MGISIGWAAACFFVGLTISVLIAVLKHGHDLDPRG